MPDSCRLEDDPSDLNVLVFLGNVIVVAVILLTILLVHITVISGVEAYWLVKASAVLTVLGYVGRRAFDIILL